jgi:hypothetical protein
MALAEGLSSGKKHHKDKGIPFIQRGVVLIRGDERFSIEGDLDH